MRADTTLDDLDDLERDHSRCKLGFCERRRFVVGLRFQQELIRVNRELVRAILEMNKARAETEP